MKTVVVIQARMESTRLPGKVLRSLAGKPLLLRQIERIMAAQCAFELCVATTRRAADEPIRELCRRASIRVVDGHPSDCLDRHYQVGIAYGADHVVKIPSDCPLIDPGAIDSVLGLFRARAGDLDFASNLYPPTWPDGNDVEVMTMAALEEAFQHAKRPFEREHTTPYLWDQPERFRIANLRWETGLDYSKSHRFTVDHPDDLAFVSRVYDELWSVERPVFSLSEILNLLDQKPELLRLNARFCGQSWHARHAAELRHFQPDGAGISGRNP